jgi:hypothetical protein
VLVRPHDGAVEDQVLAVGVVGQRREDAPPDPAAAPAVEALEHAVPSAEADGQVAPGHAGPGQPEHALDEHPVVAPPAARVARLARAEVFDPGPSRVAQGKAVGLVQGCGSSIRNLES